jgi:hypothetical protein
VPGPAKIHGAAWNLLPIAGSYAFKELFQNGTTTINGQGFQASGDW